MLEGGGTLGGMIHMRVCWPGAAVDTVVATSVVAVVCNGATLVVDVGAGAGVVEVVEVGEVVDEVDDVVDVVVDGGGSVLVVAGAEVTADDVVVWA